jgi:hypothetical protein
VEARPSSHDDRRDKPTFTPTETKLTGYKFDLETFRFSFALLEHDSRT